MFYIITNAAGIFTNERFPENTAIDWLEVDWCTTLGASFKTYLKFEDSSFILDCSHCLEVAESWPSRVIDREKSFKRYSARCFMPFPGVCYCTFLWKLSGKELTSQSCRQARPSRSRRRLSRPTWASQTGPCRWGTTSPRRWYQSRQLTINNNSPIDFYPSRFSLSRKRKISLWINFIYERVIEKAEYRRYSVGPHKSPASKNWNWSNLWLTICIHNRCNSFEYTSSHVMARLFV